MLSRLVVAIAVLGAGAFPAWAAEEVYGCEANPTGDPIGGGEGYRAILTSGDFTVRTAEELVAALKKAASGQVVYVPGDGEMDMTGYEGLVIRGGVTLAGGRGLEGKPGPLLFTAKQGTSPLFATGGPKARITGLRLRGPESSTKRTPYYAMCIMATHHALEVDNCEIYDWNYVGVGGRRGGSRLYVHHCYIHHCQRGGLGYGISLSECDARAIANIFDYCRHHIAASGNPGCAYEAAYNRVLPHATGHYFDMHGGRDRGDGTDMAGEWLDIHHNTFESAGQRTVVIRGTPAQVAEVHHNWFAVSSKSAVYQSPNTRVFKNVHGPEQELEE